MQQNVYGVGYDLAVLLATLGVGLDGDIVTTKLRFVWFSAQS